MKKAFAHAKKPVPASASCCPQSQRAAPRRAGTDTQDRGEEGDPTQAGDDNVAAGAGSLAEIGRELGPDAGEPERAKPILGPNHPHPRSLPTRGRETTAALAQMPKQTPIRLPSPLWGGSEGGGFAPRTLPLSKPKPGANAPGDYTASLRPVGDRRPTPAALPSRVHQRLRSIGPRQWRHPRPGGRWPRSLYRARSRRQRPAR
jgi:hypothetical protein